MIGVRLTQQLHLKNDATIRNEAKWHDTNMDIETKININQIKYCNLKRQNHLIQSTSK